MRYDRTRSRPALGLALRRRRAPVSLDQINVQRRSMKCNASGDAYVSLDRRIADYDEAIGSSRDMSSPTSIAAWPTTPRVVMTARVRPWPPSQRAGRRRRRQGSARAGWCSPPMASQTMKAKLYVILARNAPCGVVFRRGPSKQVLLIKWNLCNDTFESGQWLKGRIYERRCDLSPSGEKLIYLAANYGSKKRPSTWTAVSRPPYLTALAMWENYGAWGGGGLFESEDLILLNHRDSQRELADGFKLGKNVRVRPFGEYAGFGEDFPIYHTRLLRDGLILRCMGEGFYRLDAKVYYEYTKPLIYEKCIERKHGDHRLQM
jgi:hypothetical protein